MQGTGNDFIVIDARSIDPAPVIAQARRLCDRKFGIGADQLLLIRPSESADFRMQIFNTDGSEVEMCGNGIRCFAKYLKERNLTTKETLTVETAAGIMTPVIREKEVDVDMGEPILDGPQIPVRMESRVISQPVEFSGKEWKITCVSMGNPHCIIGVDDLEQFPVEKVGPCIETDPLFPNRTNVEFVQVINDRELKMRVWERGTGETLSCGTGACAATVAAVLNGWTGRKVRVHLAGGTLRIDWREDNRVILTGPAEEVFRGIIEIRR
ncbi:MAG: diaminopimelate epimerase [Deltaproteobacteria bacterium]|nr:diaminopimelate epimerase [Deltaproteobacteria bacterium]